MLIFFLFVTQLCEELFLKIGEGASDDLILSAEVGTDREVTRNYGQCNNNCPGTEAWVEIAAFSFSTFSHKSLSGL